MAKPRDKGELLLDEQGDESFPASDPPSSNVGERVGEPRRDAPRKTGTRAETRLKPTQ